MSVIEQIQTVGYLFIGVGCGLSFLAVALIYRYMKKRKKEQKEEKEESGGDEELLSELLSTLS